MREAPSITIARELKARGATIKACDPEAIGTGRAEIGDNIDQYLEDMYEVAEGADVVIVCTEWNEYRNPDFGRLGQIMKRKLVLDGRNILLESELRKHGFERYGVGIPPVLQGAPTQG